MSLKKWLYNFCAWIFSCCIVWGGVAIVRQTSLVASAEGRELAVFWIENYSFNEQENLVSFSLRTNSVNTLYIEDYQGESLKRIKINGTNMMEILRKDGMAKVTLEGATLHFSMSIFTKGELYPYAIQETAQDRITIEKGFSLPTMETTAYTTAYRFDEVLKKFVIMGNPARLDESAYGKTVMLDVNSDIYNYRQLFIHFAYPITTEYMHHMQYDAEMYVKYMRSIGNPAPTDAYCAELSLLGIRDTLLNNIIVDGKSLQEWMVLDKDKVRDPENLVMISMHHTYDRGTLMTVEFSPASSCNPSALGTHTLELREGIVFPTLVKLDGTYKYSYTYTGDPKGSNKWIAVGEETEIEPYQPTENSAEEQKTSGCNGTLSITPAVLLSFLALGYAGIALCRKRKMAADVKNESVNGGAQ